MERRDWLQEVRALPARAVYVRHEPATPRYGRAQAKLRWLLRESTVIGRRDADYPGAVEIAAWARSPSGGFGYYSCFRLFLGEDREVVAAVLFCFYDGTEKSPGFRSARSARDFALLHGFEVIP
jgi:hypothetical protein